MVHKCKDLIQHLELDMIIKVNVLEEEEEKRQEENKEESQKIKQFDINVVKTENNLRNNKYYE